MKRTRISAAAPIIVVENVVRTAEHYRDKFGFDILGYFADPPVYAMVRRDSAEIHLAKADSGGGAPTIHHNSMIRQQTCDVVIWSSEIEQLFEEFLTRGADLRQQIIKRSYGREFIARDCDGHLIMIVG